MLEESLDDIFFYFYIDNDITRLFSFDKAIRNNESKCKKEVL